MINLGDRVKDKITGLGGIAIGVTNWLYGCRRFVIQPEEGKDGKPAETFVVDEPQLDVVKVGAIDIGGIQNKETPPPHGPRNDPVRMNDPAR